MEFFIERPQSYVGSCRCQAEAAGRQLGARPVRPFACNCRGCCQGVNVQCRHFPSSGAIPRSAFTSRSSCTCSGVKPNRSNAKKGAHPAGCRGRGLACQLSASPAETISKAKTLSFSSSDTRVCRHLLQNLYEVIAHPSQTATTVAPFISVLDKIRSSSIDL